MYLNSLHICRTNGERKSINIMEEKRNPRPVEESSKLPTITLTVLIGIIAALLFVGWQYLSDSSISDNELTNISNDSLSVVGESSSLPEVKEEGESSESQEEATSSDTDEPTNKEAKPEKKPAKSEEKTTKDIDLGKGEEISHTVQAGETFYGIANRYNIKWETLQKLNPNIEPNGIKVGVTKLKVKVRAVHTVGPGDVLRVVASKYGVSKELLMQANKKKKDFTERGEKLIIPLK